MRAWGPRRAPTKCPSLPPRRLVLALGGVDSHVRLFTCAPGGEFREACRLSGHQDWVRGLAFTRDEEGELGARERGLAAQRGQGALR